jgi:hypothetical protein
MPTKPADTYSTADDYFEVMCSVGRINLSSSGTDDPYAMAFRLIGEHGAEGHYFFPGPHEGQTVHVIVEHGGES